MEQKFNIGDKVAVSAVRDASSVGYLGCLGKVKIINNNKCFVSFFNSSNGAWFFHDELIKQNNMQNTTEQW